MPFLSRRQVGMVKSDASVASDRVQSNQLYKNKGRKRLIISRSIFLVVLLGVAGVLGYTSFRLLRKSEEKLALEQFEGIARRVLDSALATTHRRRNAAMAVADNVAHAFPNASTRPNASIFGFESTAMSIMLASGTGRPTVGVCNLVEPDQLESFEDFMYNTAFKEINPQYPDTAGFKDTDGDGVLDRGVYGFDGNFHPYRETTGETWWNSTNNILCPFSMHTAGPPLLMYNAHSFQSLGKAIDDMITCASKRPANRTFNLDECAIFTDMFVTYDANGTSIGPNTFILQPVYPLHDPTTLTAVVTNGLKWVDVLDDLFPANVDGIQVVLRTDTQVHTYQVKAGRIAYVGEGDLHYESFSNHEFSISLYSPGLFADTSTSYTLSLYPEELYFGSYTTNNPKMSMVVVVAAIIFTITLFFLYDFFVHQEFHAKQAIIEAKRAYVRYVSHEIRTPLNTVVMGLSLLRDEIARRGETATVNSDGKGDAEALLTLTQEVINNTQNAVDVLNDLLAYDKIERGKLSLEKDVVPIWSLIAQTANEFRLQASAQKIHFVLDMGSIVKDEDIESNALQLTEKACEAVVVGDPVKLAQCLRNIISNGLKFTPEHGDLTITVLWHKDDRCRAGVYELQSGQSISVSSAGLLEISVADSGAGMTKEQLSQLFQDGVQFNVNKLQVGNGSGLGLFITKGIVEQHQGRLTAGSFGLSKGTTITMSLPLYYRPDDYAMKREPKSKQPTTATSDSSTIRSRRILIVDDSAVNRKLLRRILERDGHICDDTEDGRAGLELVKTSIESGDAYDTVLLDYEMPIMNGPTAAKEMRKLGFDSLVIGLTGNLMREDVDYFKSMGADTVLPKPFQMDALNSIWDDE